ncbi:zonadhesin-like isoform X2 [Elysia marginata]|uniref:Zonadhesin-like isoform X2 n=1 Tax=Elysia marginata TaxID=1093978 RepID=A0AAV4J0B9_9GAST|nr:zonadhesin-like isoform X2 [Elysia marginata]
MLISRRSRPFLPELEVVNIRTLKNKINASHTCAVYIKEYRPASHTCAVYIKEYRPASHTCAVYIKEYRHASHTCAVYIKEYRPASHTCAVYIKKYRHGSRTCAVYIKENRPASHTCAVYIKEYRHGSRTCAVYIKEYRHGSHTCAVYIKEYRPASHTCAVYIKEYRHASVLSFSKTSRQQSPSSGSVNIFNFCITKVDRTVASSISRGNGIGLYKYVIEKYSCHPEKLRVKQRPCLQDLDMLTFISRPFCLPGELTNTSNVPLTLPF